MTRRQNTKRPVLSNESLFRNGLRVFLLLVLVLGTVLAVDWVYRVDNFPVQNIRMEGRFERVQRQELSNAVMGAVKGNIFALDIDAIRKRAEALPWIYRAEVRRSWPNEIHIRFVEQKLVGRWNGTAWVNTASEVVRINNAVAYYSGLPLLSGPQGTAPKVLQRLHYFNEVLGPMGLKIESLKMTSTGSWQLKVNAGFTLLVSKKGYMREIQRFANVYTQELSPQKQQLAKVDMRYTNGFAVRWRSAPNLAARLRNEG
jgi:cell division protein FtsQ